MCHLTLDMLRVRGRLAARIELRVCVGDEVRMDADPESLLLGVVGEVLSSVVVVADYVELDFNGPRLSLFVWPTITIDGERPRQLGDPGYRDSLCSLIGHVVVATEESPSAGLRVDFAHGSVATRPQPTELRGPEIAMLRGFSDRPDWMVWRPGEGPFDGPNWS